jgi:hypothetical protein
MKTNKGHIRAASMRFASTERKPNFDLLEPHLKYSPQYQAAVASLTHNDYLAHGAIGPALLPQKWPDLKEARRTSYDRLCRHVLLFFDAILKRQAGARESLEKSVRGEGLDDGFKLRFKPAALVSPTNGQIAAYLKEHGLEKTLELVRLSTSLPTGRLAASAFLLIADGEPEAALPALRFAIKEQLTVAAHHLHLGEALTLTADRAGALAAYRKAAELLPGDESAGNNRRAYKYLIDKRLKDLGPADPPPNNR